ncbi:MAG TPA: hypothetical protein VKP65_09780 [Rhodothermales bacterium]|nr:hypothetical protein [Rhodothermales bacterium]
MLVWLMACGGETETAQLQPMQFAVDSTLLGTMVEDADLGLQFQPPKGWEALAEEQVDSIRFATRTEEVERLRPKHVFLHPEQRSVLTVSTLLRDTTVTFAEQMASYEQALASQFPEGAVRRARFLKDNIPVTQFLIQTGEVVNFKIILFEAVNNLPQLDYLVPRNQYPQTARSIESSIGSLSRFP